MNIILIDDIIKEMKVNIPGQRWMQHGYLKRGKKEYILYKEASSPEMYLEEVDIHGGDIILKKISDDSEWQDIMNYCINAGLVKIQLSQELKFG